MNTTPTPEAIEKAAARLDALRSQEGELALLRVVLERADRLLSGADFQLAGVLSAESRASEIPSNACSKVKARHLASLRDAVRIAKEAAR